MPAPHTERHAPLLTPKTKERDTNSSSDTKRVAKRLKVMWGRKGGVLGGKALVAVELRSGVAVAMATAADGETNDAKLVPA